MGTLTFDEHGTLWMLCRIVEAPIGCLGWFLVWGDNGPPYPWLDYMSVNIICGLAIAASLGAAAALLRRQQFTLKTIFIVTAIVAVLCWIATL